MYQILILVWWINVDQDQLPIPTCADTEDIDAIWLEAPEAPPGVLGAPMLPMLPLRARLQDRWSVSDSQAEYAQPPHSSWRACTANTFVIRSACEGRLTAGLMIGEGKRREAETLLSAFDRCSSPNGSLLRWRSTVVAWLRPPIRPEAWEGTDRTER